MSKANHHRPSSPPRWLDRLLEWFCAPHLLEEVLGDLHERYYLRAQRVGEARARSQYWWEVLSYLRPSVFQRKSSDYRQTTSTDMLRNYFTIALRNLWRNKSFSAINISGLAIGIATCLVIMLFVQHELSYDRFNEKADRMVRVVFRGSMHGEKLNIPQMAAPTAQALQTDYPEVLEVTRLREGGQPFVTYGNKTYKEDKFAFVDSNFFQVFTIPFLQGNPKTALIQPNTMVITRAIARKYFGHENPMGKVLTLKNLNIPYTITGVIEKVPDNAHFHFNFFPSLATLPEAREQSWLGNSVYYTYLVLPQGYDYKRLEAKLPQMLQKYLGPQIQQAMGMSLEQFLNMKKGDQIGMFLQPLTDIHLRSDFAMELEAGGDIRYVYIFGAIALFMLLIACINFMNLSTASASKRAREVGIRKVLGSVKSQLVRQFLLESVMMAALALLLGIVFVNLSLPFFNELTGKELSLTFTANAWLLPGLLLFGLLVGVVAGSYPAFFLSSFKPVSVLKGGAVSGTFNARGKAMNLRSGLVIFQFFVSIALMVGTAIVFQQLTFIQNKKLGYDKDQVLVLHDTYLLGSKEEVFRNQLLQDPRVLNASISNYLPVGPTDSDNLMVWAEGNTSQTIRTLLYHIDYNYIPTLGMQLVAGRGFSKAFATDSTAVVINETAARTLGWGNNAVGRSIIRMTDNQGGKATCRVIGVVKDFHFKSLHECITPLIMMVGQNSGALIVKVKTKDVAGLTVSMKKQWGNLTSDAPFTYTFLDERFQATYQLEGKVGRILALFAGLTIFVACLGLFGLATFTTEQRTKEIGIRKVLGASVSNIVGLLSRDFFRLVLVANVIAWPLAWWAMNKWLEGFAYRVEIGFWVFALAGISALLIALLTVSFQAIKAAVANPVKSLRTE